MKRVPMRKLLDFTPTRCAARDSILNDPARLMVVCAGRSGGKWEFCGVEFMNRVLDTHPLCRFPLYGYCYPTQKQGRRTVWPKLVRRFKQAGAVRKINEVDMRIELSNNATVFCLGLDNSESVEGNHYCGMAVDEASDTKPAAITNSILPAINAYHGWLMLLGIPKHAGVGGDYYKKICDLAQSGEEAIDGFTTSYHHWASTEIYTPKEIAAYQKLMDPKTFNEHFLATWETASGKVYHAFNRAVHVHPLQYNPQEPLLIGCDFNVNPMSWVVCQGDENNIRVLDEVRIRNTWTQETLDVLFRRYGQHRAGFRFYCDAAGKQRHTSADITDIMLLQQDKRFKRYASEDNVVFRSCNMKVFDRVTMVNSMLQNALGERRIEIDPRCTCLIKDLESISFVEGRDKEVDKSDPELTHMADALGYLIIAAAPMGMREYMQKSTVILGG